MNEFEYTFDHLANMINDFVEEIKLERYKIYVHDYGAPVGFRLASKHLERIQAIITQNGNTYEEVLQSLAEESVFSWSEADNNNKPNSHLFISFLTNNSHSCNSFPTARICDVITCQGLCHMRNK